MNRTNLIYVSIIFLLFIEGIGIHIAYRKHCAIFCQFHQNTLDFQNFKKRKIDLSFLVQFEEEKKKYEEKALQLINFLRRCQFPLEAKSSPQSFQDKLRERVSTLTAGSNKVKFPSQFYLGFDQYRSALPPQEIAVELDRELEIIFGLVQKFVQIPIASILAIHRFPFSPRNPSHLSEKIEKKIFDICFIADQAAFRNAVNAIVNFSHFLSIEALQVCDTQPQTLKKEGKSAEEKEHFIAPRDSRTELIAKGKLRRLFLKEELTVTIRIAMLIFTFAEET